MKKLIILLISILAISIFGIVMVFATTNDINFIKSGKVNQEESFIVGDIEQINFNFNSSDVNVILVDSEEVKVTYYGDYKCIFCNVERQLIGTKTDEYIEFETQYDWIQSGISLYTKIKIDVYLPKTYEHNLTFTVSSSDITIENINLNKVDITSSSGDIYLKELSLEELSIDSSSGDIETINVVVNNQTDINTSSGDVDIDGLLSDISIRTSSGDVDFNNKSDSFQIDINTSSGHVDLNLNDDVSFNFITRTSSGKIKINFSYTVSDSHSDDEYIEGYVNQSNNHININTSSGDIDIR